MTIYNQGTKKPLQNENIKKYWYVAGKQNSPIVVEAGEIMKICKICREIFNDSETFCKVCGEILDRSSSYQTLSNEDITAIIIFVMGIASIIFVAILFF